MLKIRIIVVGRTRSPFIREGELFYLDRLRRYAHTEWEEVKPASIKKGRSDKIILAAESDSIARRILPRDYVIVLDRSGKAYESRELAESVQDLSLSNNRLSFIIGGPLGLSEKILQRAQATLSLSRMTFTHEMSRLIFLEQLYRAFTIIRGEKYHK